jgi:hypothetical protein
MLPIVVGIVEMDSHTGRIRQRSFGERRPIIRQMRLPIYQCDFTGVSIPAKLVGKPHSRY